MTAWVWISLGYPLAMGWISWPLLPFGREAKHVYVPSLQRWQATITCLFGGAGLTAIGVQSLLGPWQGAVLLVPLCALGLVCCWLIWKTRWVFDRKPLP